MKNRPSDRSKVVSYGIGAAICLGNCVLNFLYPLTSVLLSLSIALALVWSALFLFHLVRYLRDRRG